MINDRTHAPPLDSADHGPRIVSVPDALPDAHPVMPQAASESARHGAREVRCAVRFPLALPATIESGGEEFAALTRNISASGILFELERSLSAGAEVRYSVRMPAEVLGADHDVLVHCTGRVIRCSLSQNQYLVAATIDDYRLAEH